MVPEDPMVPDPGFPVAIVPVAVLPIVVVLPAAAGWYSRDEAAVLSPTLNGPYYSGPAWDLFF